MKVKRMKYIGEEERIVPRHGVFKPGDEVEFQEELYETRLFVILKNKKEDKDGEA